MVYQLMKELEKNFKKFNEWNPLLLKIFQIGFKSKLREYYSQIIIASLIKRNRKLH